MRFVPSEGYTYRRHLPALLGHFEPFSPWVLDSDREVIRLSELNLANLRLGAQAHVVLLNLIVIVFMIL
jgi:hypothetical protein